MRRGAERANACIMQPLGDEHVRGRVLVEVTAIAIGLARIFSDEQRADALARVRRERIRAIEDDALRGQRVVRVVTDARWRREKSLGLSMASTSLVRRARRAPVRIDKKTLPPRERADLEKRCILHISSRHTERGAHETLARSWDSWASASLVRQAAKLDLENARRDLARWGLPL